MSRSELFELKLIANGHGYNAEVVHKAKVLAAQAGDFALGLCFKALENGMASAYTTKRITDFANTITPAA
ncbi:hypothetical protein [Reinekea sp. G2M2-21]|uniref:hypothetical protein n=1 Tax=Reinekea sp. G2M2-21 TaxID=2788942 RepID=UPI0018AB7EDC|nr:hypothetical protein [Reinekea sp. G2M2-21]